MKLLYFIFTTAVRTAPVRDTVLPKAWSAAVNVSNGEAVLHVVYCRDRLELVPQSVRLLLEKLLNSISCLKSRSIGGIKDEPVICYPFNNISY